MKSYTFHPYFYICIYDCTLRKSIYCNKKSISVKLLWMTPCMEKKYFTVQKLIRNMGKLFNIFDNRCFLVSFVAIAALGTTFFTYPPLCFHLQVFHLLMRWRKTRCLNCTKEMLTNSFHCLTCKLNNWHHSLQKKTLKVLQKNN